MANPSARLASACLMVCYGALGCGEVSSLAVSAGAPVMAAVRGRITDCGNPVAGAEVVLRVRQDQAEQARPVDAQIGPLITERDGTYIAEIGPPFAFPGQASLDVTVTAAGSTAEVKGAALHFELGRPPRDTVRADVDLATYRGFCFEQ